MINMVSIVVLVVALIASNVFWISRLVRAGSDLSDLLSQFNHAEGSLRQALAVLKMSLAREATRDNIIEAARRLPPQPTPVERDGYVWAGALGFKFDGDGRLTYAVPAPWPEDRRIARTPGS
jgi:hypothetical protein